MTEEILEDYDRLLEVIRLLACEADVQIGSFPDGINVTDEIAILFEECYRSSDYLRLEGRISAHVKLELDDTNLKFKKMSKQHMLWSNSSLAESEEWLRIRRNARDILELMGADYKVPSLFWLQFVNAR